MNSYLFAHFAFFHDVPKAARSLVQRWSEKVRSPLRYLKDRLSCHDFLLNAETEDPLHGFNIAIPQFVKDELNIWIDYITTPAQFMKADDGEEADPAVTLPPMSG